MTDMIRAPWTSEQVAALDQFQTASGMHPFTCGAERHALAPRLVPSHSGWYCPDPDCDYQQDWAHAFMANPGAWPQPFGERHGPTPQKIAAATAHELTAEEARSLADDLGLQLYEAQDALAFVAECCTIAERDQRPITTADVREWLKGARCGRQLAADAVQAAARAEGTDTATWTAVRAIQLMNEAGRQRDEAQREAASREQRLVDAHQVTVGQLRGAETRIRVLEARLASLGEKP